MEDCQQAIIRMEEHTRDMKDNLKDAATKDDLEGQTQIIVAIIKANSPKNGVKDKLLWVLVLALIALAGATSVIEYLAANGGG